METGSTDVGETIEARVQRTPDLARRHRRRILAALEAAWLSAGIAPEPAEPDPCAGRCGALGVLEREGWSRRNSCPCREQAS
ncbi:hypothetical protein ACFWUU_02080 [Kribbella sp. NPDC058693]|uniref:hypothetical protein n=1 Tax=Kribbella sp. NPDC058693 TaxID=3346602 RepID=UPI00365FFCB4